MFLPEDCRPPNRYSDDETEAHAGDLLYWQQQAKKFDVPVTFDVEEMIDAINIRALESWRVKMCEKYGLPPDGSVEAIRTIQLAEFAIASEQLQRDGRLIRIFPINPSS